MASKMDMLRKKTQARTPAEERITANMKALESVMHTERAEHRLLELDKITPNPLNDYILSDTDEDITTLANDIERNGLLHNLVVSYTMQGDFLLLSGERRLRALKRLREKDPAEEKWWYADCAILRGLDSLEEAIILDSANLNTRGVGTNSEAQYRKATVRFIKNLSKKYNLTEAEATELAAKYTAVAERTLQRNLAIETQLDERLVALADNGTIQKADAYLLATRAPNEQAHIASVTEELDSETSREYIAEVAAAARKHKPIKSVKAKTPEKNATPVKSLDTKKDIVAADIARLQKYVNKMYEKRGQIAYIDEGNVGGTKGRLKAELVKARDTLTEIIDGI